MVERVGMGWLLLRPRVRAAAAPGGGSIRASSEFWLDAFCAEVDRGITGERGRFWPGEGRWEQLLLS